MLGYKDDDMKRTPAEEAAEIRAAKRKGGNRTISTMHHSKAMPVPSGSRGHSTKLSPRRSGRKGKVR